MDTTLDAPPTANSSGGSKTRWEGYSDYRAISLSVAASIDKALDAYARINSAHAEGARVGTDEAAEARAHILSAALKLYPEMLHDRESVEVYDKILRRWEDQPDEQGFISRFNNGINLRTECPGWLFRFVLDMRTAGWELGYLQAGRTAKGEPDDPDEAQVRSMFEQ